MKRITDEEIRKATLLPVGFSDFSKHKAIADAQLESDKEAVENCREKIARAFRKENRSTYECDNHCSEICP